MALVGSGVPHKVVALVKRTEWSGAEFSEKSDWHYPISTEERKGKREMADPKQDEFRRSHESQGKAECGADCPNCVGGTCVLEMGHTGLHQCASCGNTWETFHRSVLGADL